MRIFDVVLAFHVAGASVALVSGALPILSRKGGRLHRRSGRLFTASLSLGVVAAFALSLMTGNRLLLTISVLTGFLMLTGLRAAAFRRGARDPGAGALRCPGAIDWGAALLLAGFGVWLLCASLHPADVTGLFFGAGSLLVAGRHVRVLRALHPDWLLVHLGGMGGAYLATVTAFLVVNVHFLPKPVVFILPVLFGSALITRASLRRARPRGGSTHQDGLGAREARPRLLVS